MKLASLCKRGVGTLRLRECLQELFLSLNYTSLELPACLHSYSTVEGCVGAGPAL